MLASATPPIHDGMLSCLTSDFRFRANPYQPIPWIRPPCLCYWTKSDHAVPYNIRQLRRCDEWRGVYGRSDLRLMCGMCMIVILEMFRRFVMMPRCLFVMLRC